MPRRSRSSESSKRAPKADARSSTPAPKADARSTPARKPPAKVASAPPPARAPAPNESLIERLVIHAVAEFISSVAFNTAKEVAHRAVDAVMGPRVIRHETLGSSSKPIPSASAPAQNVKCLGSDPCASQTAKFQACLNSSRSEISRCQFYMDMLSECERGSRSTISD